MSKFLIIEEPRENRSIFYNFAVVDAEDSEEAESKYLKKMDVDLDRTSLEVFDVDDIDTDFYYYLEVDLDKIKLK